MRVTEVVSSVRQIWSKGAGARHGFGERSLVGGHLYLTSCATTGGDLLTT